MERSESIKELSTALSKAQGELKNPRFDSENPHFRSKFASLAAVRDAVIPVLSKHGLAITQWPLGGDGMAGCVTVLSHVSGESMQQQFLIPVEKQNAHGYASALTYTRRLSLQSIAGVVGDEDDDANASLKKAPSPMGDAHEGVTAEQKKRVESLYSAVLDAFNAEYTPERIVDMIDNANLDNDEKVFLASLGFSREQKAALKKAVTDKRAKEKA